METTIDIILINLHEETRCVVHMKDVLVKEYFKFKSKLRAS